MAKEDLDVGLHNLAPAKGSKKRRKVIGRGPGSGHGKTSARGQKGQYARGQLHRPGFEGGQMPLYRRLPKRGFTNHTAREVAEFKLGLLNAFEDGTVVELSLLKKLGLVASRHHGFKVIGGGSLSRKLKVRATGFSASARRDIEKAGGACELVPYRTPYIRQKKSAKKVGKK